MENQIKKTNIMETIKNLGAICKMPLIIGGLRFVMSCTKPPQIKSQEREIKDGTNIEQNVDEKLLDTNGDYVVYIEGIDLCIRMGIDVYGIANDNLVKSLQRQTPSGKAAAKPSQITCNCNEETIINYIETNKEYFQQQGITKIYIKPPIYSDSKTTKIITIIKEEENAAEGGE